MPMNVSGLVAGLLVLCTLALALPASSHVMPGVVTSTCGAAGAASCSTGGHLRIGIVLDHGPDPAASWLFTGPVLSRVYVPGYPAQDQSTSCIFLVGVPFSCETTGTPPLVGWDFVHECDAAGIGAWGCYVTHD